MKNISPFYWKNNTLYILNQKKLPHKIEYIKCKTYLDVANCIKDMIVRGAPAIGIAAAYGFALAMKNINKKGDILGYIENVCNTLVSSRPTAVNLFWAVSKIRDKVEKNYRLDNTRLFNIALNTAKKIHKEEVINNLKIARLGSKLLRKGSVVLTHCNAGGLATGGIGTALGIIIQAYRNGRIDKVFVDETRPYLQGARLTIFELMLAKVPCLLISDNMAGFVIKNKKVNAIIVGADRIAKNGDTANKIGTYTLSILAKYHKIPFYVAAPTSTIDTKISDGNRIDIEERSEEELKLIEGKLITSPKAKVYHPAFDVTPAENITAIITEKGIFKYPYKF